MELRHVRAFLAVADERHFSRAAARLHMSQPPLSAAIRELERELGVDLFERTTRSVRILPAGEALLEPARAVMRAIEAMQHSAAATASGTVGTVRAGFGGTSGYGVLADLVGACRAAEPGIRIELVPQTYSGDAIEQVAAGDLDLAITGSVPRPPVTSLVLGTERLVLAVPEGHRLADAARIRPKDLRGEPLVVYPSEHGSWVRAATEAMLNAADLPLEIASEAPDPFSLLALVSAGVGAAVVVDHSDRLHVDGVRYVPFTGTKAATFPLRLAWREPTATPTLERVLQVARALLTTETPD